MSKIVTLRQNEDGLDSFPIKAQKTVVVGGCFDVLHRGHLEFLKNAKSLGDHLIVFLESDKSVMARKGKNRPVNTQIDRARILSALESVDSILLLPYFQTDKEYFELVNTIKPDIIAITKGDPYFSQKKEQADSINAQLVEVMGRKKGYSTKEIIEKSQLI